MNLKTMINKYILGNSLIKEEKVEEENQEISRPGVGSGYRDFFLDGQIDLYDGRTNYPYDSELDLPNVEKIRNPRLISAILHLDAAIGDTIIVNAITEGSYKIGYLEFDLVLRYKPYHFSWGGCYSHYFLNGKFTGDIRKTDTKSMYSSELVDLGRYSNPQLYDLQIKRLGTLVEALELRLDTKFLDKSEFEKIYR